MVLKKIDDGSLCVLGMKRSCDAESFRVRRWMLEVVKFWKRARAGEIEVLIVEEWG